VVEKITIINWGIRIPFITVLEIRSSLEFFLDISSCDDLPSQGGNVGDISLKRHILL